MSLYKRGGVYWSYLYRDGVREQFSTKTGNRKEAQKIEDKRKHELNDARFQIVEYDKSSGELLGVHIIGPLATEILAEAVTALQLEATVDDLMSTVHAHPTVWEAMADAVAAVRGLSINA